MRVLFAATEMAPFATTGGLGDVVGSLPAALADSGVRVGVALPLSKFIDRTGLKLKPFGGERSVPLSGKSRNYRLFKARYGKLELFFIDQPSFFDRDSIYGASDSDYPDNAERFIFFSRAVCKLAASLRPAPSILHAHDWHTALVPVLAAADPGMAGKLGDTATVLTIHNLGYQGIFPENKMLAAGLPATIFNPQGLEFWGRMNFLKG
ncbi:MAG TPA: glycogen/starch synthase, partial [Candidatus Glassbacteria bacterium]|nr:glycogen/starch synthase [Candidatus Glassbacteria bacterium]